MILLHQLPLRYIYLNGSTRVRSQIKAVRAVDIAAVEATLSKEPALVYTPGALLEIIRRNARTWRLPKKRADDLIPFLVERTKLREIVLSSSSYAPILRYDWDGTAAPAAIAVSIKGRSYLSHGSALWVHGLRPPTDTYYVNHEQSAKDSDPDGLTQSAIDRAFKRPQRCSRFVYEFRGNKTVVINGKQTGQLEVITAEITRGTVLPVTSLERTLIDIAVRPAYTGGLFDVMAAFRAARGRLNVTRMLDVLERLGYVYPYHQVIGFYLSRAGFPADDLNQLRRIGHKFAFYATYGMRQPKFNPDWQVYYPEEIDSAESIVTSRE